MQEKGLTDPDVYSAGKITKQQFNSMINQKTARVSRNLAIKTAFGLGLDLKDAQELIHKAGYFFPCASQSEYILSACFRCHVRDYKEVDHLLTTYGKEPFFDRKGSC